MSLFPKVPFMPTALRNVADLKVIRFGLVGVVNTLLDLILFSLLVQGASMGVVPANILSYSTGILNSFLLNRTFTFRDRSKGSALLKSLLIFIGVNLLGLTFSTVLVALFSTIMDDILAKVVSVPLVFCWNFLASRYLVFGDAAARRGLATVEGGS